MAEPISLASGLLALATFAFQSSIALYKTVQSFRIHPKTVRDLNEELQDLSGVLQSIADTVRASTDVDLSALNLPLLRCGNACKEFEREILKCLSHSSATRTSFRDWAKLRYMGDNIDAFRQLLAGYKSTITIALTDVNLQKSSVTAERIESYRDMIKLATDDLEAHLQNIDEKLELVFRQTVTESDSDATELRIIKEERLSTQKCLQICAQLADHINQIQLRPIQRKGKSTGVIDPEDLPETFTNEGLEECKNSLSDTVAKLERHMQDLIDRLITKSKTAMTSEEIEDLSRLREEWAAARQSLEIYSKANSNLKENISVIDNYSTGDDTIQLLVSTEGKTIHGKNRGYGFRTRQFGGHINDTSFQQLSRDFSRIDARDTGSESPSSRDNTPSGLGNTTDTVSGSEFKDRYGQGFKLTPKSTQNTRKPSQQFGEGEASSSAQGEGGKSQSS